MWVGGATGEKVSSSRRICERPANILRRIRDGEGSVSTPNLFPSLKIIIKKAFCLFQTIHLQGKGLLGSTMTAAEVISVVGPTMAAA